MKIDFNNPRVFWGCAGGAGAVVVLMLLLWVIPTAASSNEASAAYAEQLKNLEVLQATAKKIPSNATLREREEYRAFVDQQAEWGRNFFAERSKLLEQNLAGEGQVAPLDFKDAYVRQIDEQKRQLAGKLGLADPANPYKTYKWMAGSALPSPTEYQSVLRDYWTRYYLYRLSANSGVTKVTKLDVRDAAFLSKDFDRVTFSIVTILPPERVTRYVETILTVAPTITDRPVFQLDGARLSPNGDGSVTLQLDGGVLIFKKAGEKPAAAAAAPAIAGGKK